MNNKVNVEIIIPEIDQNYNVFLPITKKMGSIALLLCKAINELTNNCFPVKDVKIYNAENLMIYQPDVLLYNTDIRNGTKLIILSK